jgi:hypothetical protein
MVWHFIVGMAWRKVTHFLRNIQTRILLCKISTDERYYHGRGLNMMWQYGMDSRGMDSTTRFLHGHWDKNVR